MKEKEFITWVVKGSGGGGKGGGGNPTPRVAQEEPNTLQSKATLRIIEVISEGEIEGLVDGAKSIYLDDTPLQNANGSYNFQGINYYERTGTPDQDHISGFPSVEDETAVNVKLEFGSPVVRSLINSDIDAFRVAFRVPALTYQDPSTGDLMHNWTGFKIEFQWNGGSYQTLVDSYVEGKTTSPYEFAWRINLGAHGPSDFPVNIRLSRTREDNEHAYEQNDIYWARYTEIIDDKLIYPDTALIGMEVDSSLFGNSVPTRSYDVYGLKIKIPTNYDPDTREYTGVWDGTFTTAWSDNPAWVLYDLITNNRYGLGLYLGTADVDKYALYTIAQYCDELVWNGYDGYEPRFTFNGVIESQSDAMKVIQSVASCFRGMLYWGAEGNTGIVIPVQDSPKDAIKIFTAANVIDGVFTYSGSALTARHSVVYVTWSDPENGYKPSVEVVEDSDLIESYGIRKVDLAAYGCTSRGQANRLGKWVLDTEAHETETVVFKVGLADADVRPGDIIKVQDSHYADVRYGGRLVSSTVTTATLDSEIEITDDALFDLFVQLPNGKLFQSRITNVPGTYTTLTVQDAFLTSPGPNTNWAITSTSLSPREFRVIELRESGDIEFEISALLYDSSKYARVEQNLNLPPLTFTNLRVGVIDPPTNLNVTEYLYKAGVAIQSGVTISWEASPDSRVVRYEVEARQPTAGSSAPNSSIFKFIGGTQGVSIDLRTTIDGTWSFRVRAFDALGNASDYLAVYNMSLIANAAPPAAPETFTINPIGDSAILRWSEVTSLNLDHYEIRYSSLVDGSATWNTAQSIVDNAAKSSTTVSVVNRSGTYFIKGVSISTSNHPFGVYSLNAAEIITNIDAYTNFNFIESLQEEPDFLGAKTHCLAQDAALILDIEGFDWDAVADVDALDNADSGGYPFYAQGTYVFENEIDLGAVYSSRVTALLTAQGLNIENDVDTWTDVDAIVDVDEVNESDWDVKLEIRTTEDDPGGSPVWSAWSEFQVADYLARGLQFRLQMYSYNPVVTPYVTGLQVNVDMPDSLRSGNDIAVTSAGLTITYDPPFRSANPAIGIAAQNMVTGDYFTITSKSATGFFIRFFNSSATPVARTFDYVARGYGYG